MRTLIPEQISYWLAKATRRSRIFNCSIRLEKLGSSARQTSKHLRDTRSDLRTITFPASLVRSPLKGAMSGSCCHWIKKKAFPCHQFFILAQKAINQLGPDRFRCLDQSIQVDSMLSVNSWNAFFNRSTGVSEGGHS